MSKEKQIEEMAMTPLDVLANDIYQHCPDLKENYCGDTHCVACLANALYNAGYRKQSENVIELPCKLGTTLYFLYNSPYADKPDLAPRIYQTTDWYFEIDKTGIVINTSDIHSFNKKYDYCLGETVFFTKEEAEKVIDELKKKYMEGKE